MNKLKKSKLEWTHGENDLKIFIYLYDKFVLHLNAVPVITLIFSLLGFAVIPFGPSLYISDFNLGILYFLAVSSISTYGILIAGWSANSKYAFLGSLRSTAQLISYELVLSSAILLVIFLTGNLNFTVNIEAQRAVWFILPLFPAQQLRKLLVWDQLSNSGNALKFLIP